jgi:hypothetical protein
MEVTGPSGILPGFVDGSFEVGPPGGGDGVWVAEDMLPAVEGE